MKVLLGKDEISAQQNQVGYKSLKGKDSIT
jgi:hypothetical protein